MDKNRDIALERVYLRGDKLWIWPDPGQSLIVTIEIEATTAERIRTLASDTTAYEHELAGIMMGGR